MRHGLLSTTIMVLGCFDVAPTTGGADESTTAGPTSTTTPGTETSMSGATGNSGMGTTSEASTGFGGDSTTSAGGESTSAGGDSTTSGSSTSGRDGGSSSSTGTETSCEAPAVDGSAIGQDCMGAACPEGYECIDHHGIVLQQLCGIPCKDDCMCPAGYTCTEFMDKAGTHYECA